MIPPIVIIIVLALLVAAACLSLWLDAGQRRIDRQLAVALPTSEAEKLLSIRRSQTRSRWQSLQALLNYRAETPYLVHPAYVLFAGIAAGGAVLYVNSFFGLSGFYVGIALAAVPLMVVRGLFGWQRQRFTDGLFRQLPDAVQLVTSTVRSGLPVQEAFRIIAREMPQPTAGQFAIVCSEINLGRAPDEAIESVYRRTQVVEYGIFATTLAVQLKSGGSLSETLQTLGETVRQRVALAARAKALAAEVIFSSRALTIAPFIVGGIIYSLSPILIDPLFTESTGHTLLAYAVCSVIVGHLVIRWIIRKETAL